MNLKTIKAVMQIVIIQTSNYIWSRTHFILFFTLQRLYSVTGVI